MGDIGSRFPAEEMERRRAVSVETMKARDREEFARWYQEKCDQRYWTRGQCCAGCDHWHSDAGNLGECTAAGIVSGAEVLRSMGITFSSYTPAPGFPMTKAEFHCGKFSDNFDWSTLDRQYLERIGAMRNGKLRARPAPVREER